MLKNPELQKIIKEIDSSDNRLGALRSVMAQDKNGDSDFSHVIDLMLLSAGFLDEEGVSTL